MNENIIILLCLFGYIIIAAIIIGIADRNGPDNDCGLFCGLFWPFLIVSFIILGIGYLPYKIASGAFRKKKK